MSPKIYALNPKGRLKHKQDSTEINILSTHQFRIKSYFLHSMPHNPLAACNSHSITHSPEEQVDAIVELADTIRELADQFSRVQQTLDIYESRMLRAEPEALQLHRQPDANNLKQWQKFVERVSQELDTLTSPV